MSGMRELSAQMKAVAGVISEHVGKAFRPLAERLDAFESKLADIEASKADHSQAIRAAAKEAFDALPTPKDGKHGADGKDADPEEIKRLINEAVSAIPVPKNGDPGRDGTDGKDGAPGRDGESVPLDVVQRMIDEAVAKAVSAISMPKDGAAGRDALDIDVLPSIDPAKSYQRGTYATHDGGLWRAHSATNGMRGWECIVDGVKAVGLSDSGERGFAVTLELASGRQETKELQLPSMIYKGVFQQGAPYHKGDTVTWGGSLWHCDAPTPDKPGEPGSKGWTLAAKRGRDGRDGTNGRDLTKGVPVK